MATEINFSAEEWSVLRNTPHIVSMALAGVGGGILGAIQEAMAAPQAMVELGQSQSQLVNMICAPQEVQNGQAEVQKALMSDPRNGTPEKLRELALAYCGQAAAILAQRAPGEAADYSAMVIHVADAVAKAAKEGGFLGFGGELVSEEEKALLAAIEAALRSGGVGGRGGIGVLTPSRPAIGQEPAQPEPQLPRQPAPAQPSQPSTGGKFPGLQPKSPQGPQAPAPQAPAQPAPAKPAAPKISSKTKSSSKGGFKTGSGLRKSK